MRDAGRLTAGGGAGPLDARFAVPLARQVVARPRLNARLTTGLECPCTVLTAPAGWGKTLLVTSWLTDSDDGHDSAWITLGPAENDVRAFWASVTTALAAAVGEHTAAALRNVASADDAEHMPGEVAGVLGAAGTPVILVLDNLHELTALAVHESLLRLVQRPPPGLRFVVTTRRDPPWPLHRLRLTGVLTEIRAADLAFRTDEAAAMFTQLGIGLGAEHIDRLVDRTEGWAAGLRLAALELQRAENPIAFVDAFSGDDHAVAAYLWSEVIDRQPPELLDFLVRVSVLDLVSADLADALTSGSTGAATLAELAASNLFVQAVGPGGRWYRLHRLISDVLRARITDPRKLRDLHRRAAEWYRLHAMPLDAVRYALRGGLWPLAADLLSVHVLTLVVRGGPWEVDVLLSAVPRDALLGHPELAAALAAARIYQGSSAEVAELTAAARAGIDRLPRPRAVRLRVVLDLVEIGHARARGDLVAVAAACRRLPDDPAALATLGLAAWDVVPLVVLANAGTAELWTGNLDEAEKHLRAAVDTDQAGGVLRPHINAAAHLSLLRCERGDLDAAASGAMAVIARAMAAGWAVSPQIVTAYLTLGWVALDRDEPQEVDRWLGRVAEVEAVTPEPHVQLAAAALTALRRADAGDIEGALNGLRSTTARLAATPPPVLEDRLLRVEADLLRRAADLPRAGQVLTGLRELDHGHAARAVARLHLAGGDLAAAQEVLGQFPTDGTTRERVEDAVLRSLVTAGQDRLAALDLLEDALLAAAPIGIRRPFLVEAADLRELLGDRIEAGTSVAAFAVDLLRRMSGQRARPPTLPAEALTDREHVVLRYLASTLSNAEIAAELYLSVNTVKSHQRMIYRKLGADGRRDAVRRAKELRIF
jgi:LuxR family transcriptional regulator, maltose regulon positive regulatory protein